MLFRLRVQGTWGAVKVAPKATAADVATVASGVLVIVELRVISARRLGATVREGGERACYESCLGG